MAVQNGDTPWHRLRLAFGRLATKASVATGSAMAFTIALATIVAWALTGPIFHFSDTWQLVINTATTIVTFLMVFLIQHAQNKDTEVIHIKLNELIAAMEGASNRLVDLEDLSEDQIRDLHDRYHRFAQRLGKAQEDRTAHNVEDELQA